MKVLMPFVRLMAKHWAWMLLGFALTFVALCAGVGLLSLSGWFIAAAAYAGLHLLNPLAFNFLLPSVGVRLFSFTRILGRYSERVVTHEATFKILTDLRVWVFRAIEPLAPAKLYQSHRGELLNRLVNDVDVMNNLYLRVLTPGFLAVLIIVVLSLLIVLVNGMLAWVIFGWLLITLLLVSIVSVWCSRTPGEGIQIETNALRRKAVDHIQHLKVLLLFSADKNNMQQLDRNSEQLIRLQEKLAWVNGLSVALVNLLLGLAVGLVLYFGVSLMATGVMQGAALAGVVLGLFATSEVILSVPLALSYFGNTHAAASRLQQVLAQSPAVEFVEHATQVPASHAIHFESIDFGYATSNPLFENFSLSIRAGEKVGLVGPSGAGKSTLLHLLSRVYDPQHGRVMIGDIDLRDLSEASLRDCMTVISQRSYIFSDTLRNNLLLAKPSATDAELISALKKVKLDALLSSLPHGFDTWLGESGVTLSGGEQRRIAVARAILHAAPIWLLDEPTEGLDAVTRAHMLRELQSLMQNKTVLFVSHRRSDLAEMDRIIALPQTQYENDSH